MPRKKKYDYFDAFIQQSELAVKEAELLVEALENFHEAQDLIPMIKRSNEIEHAGDDVNHAIHNNIAVDFMPPIDREDILNLASALDNVIDNIEDVLQHFYMYDVHFMTEDAKHFAELIRKSCYALEKASDAFRNFKKAKNFHQLIVDVNTNEEEGDALYLACMRRLHTEETKDPVRLLVWSRMYTQMEKCCDCCEHAADAMNNVVIKNM